ncbi:MAG: acyl-CoA dehydrogenase family protein [Catenulispora sp.]
MTGPRPDGALARARALVPELRARAAKDDEQASFPTASLDLLRADGLMGLLVPREHGGAGGTLADLSAVARVLAGGCLSTALIWAMHCQQVVTIADHATPALGRRLLPRIAAGEVYVASVTSERGKGGHLTSAVAPLVRRGGTVLLERDAPIVTGGEHADGFLVTMRDGDQAAEHAVTLVYADRVQVRAVSTDGGWNPMGMRATHSSALRLSGEVPADQIVGPAGRFRDVAAALFAPAAHIAWASCWLGAATAVTRDVLALLRTPSGRREFDARSDLLLDRIARIRLDLDAVHALLTRVIRDVDAARGAGADAVPGGGGAAAHLRINGLKIFAAETLMGTADRLMDLTGLRHGYMRDAAVPVERLFRDLKAARLNYSNDRLTAANGLLAHLDPEVCLD